MPVIIIAWIIGITVFSVFGSLYARKYSRPDLLVVLYATFLLVAQVLAAKITVLEFGSRSVTVPAGILVFSVTFLLTDVVNERFGRRETQRMIFLGLLAQMAMVFFFWVGIKMPPAPFWDLQEPWGRIFGMVPRITVASWVAFLVAENADAYIFAWFHKLTRGHHLWARNAFSSIPALALDSLIFVPLAFGGTMPLLPLIVGQVLIKWLTCVVDIPFMYLNKWVLGPHGIRPENGAAAPSR